MRLTICFNCTFGDTPSGGYWYLHSSMGCRLWTDLGKGHISDVYSNGVVP